MTRSPSVRYSQILTFSENRLLVPAFSSTADGQRGTPRRPSADGVTRLPSPLPYVFHLQGIAPKLLTHRARRRRPATPAGRGAGITAASPGGRPARRAAERRRRARAFSGREAGNPGAHREQYGRAGRRERTGGMHRTGPEPTEGVSQRMERVLQGRRVRLRPLRKEDLPRRLEMINDPQVQELWIGVPAD